MPSRDVQLQGIDIERRLRDHRPRMRSPHSDFVGLANDLYAELDIAPLEALIENQDPAVNASYYYQPDSSASQAMRTELEADLQALRKGKWVAAAVFRVLHGRWNLSRRVESNHPLCPSGSLTGFSSFVLRGEYEYGSTEGGTFAPDAGMGLQPSSRQYIYRHSEGDDRINVYFDEADPEGLVGQRFLHSLQFIAPEEQVEFPQSSQPKEGWRAVGEHLCGDNVFKAFYDFTFAGARLVEFGITFEAGKGLGKDCVWAGRYTR
jgi:hypothetical protein